MTTVALTEQQWHTLANDDHVLALVREECARQLAQWDVVDHPMVVWLGIITEQVGQAATATLSHHPEREAEIERQLVHVAACAISAIESLRRRSSHRFMANASAMNTQDSEPRS